MDSTVAVVQPTLVPAVGRVMHNVRQGLERVRSTLATRHPDPVPGCRRLQWRPTPTRRIDDRIPWAGALSQRHADA
jgi:hypothetical protein